MKSVSHIILATLLSTGTAVAQETIDFDRHDTNNDGFLTDQEWTGIDAVDADFDALDADGDGMLSEAEVMATAAVETESEPQTGADLERSEVSTQDHSNVQRGQIDRNADEQDPVIRGAAETAATGAEPQAEQTDVTADEQAVATDEQPDVEMQNADAPAERDTAVTAASDESGGDQASSPASSAGMNEATGTQSVQAAAQGGATPEGRQAFRDADADGDNRLSQGEVRDAGYDYVVMYFEPLDVNRDSYLDESEWDQDNGGQQAAPGIRDRQDAGLPVNGDGAQETRFERSAYEGDDGTVRFEEDFDTYDINDDGFLDESEAVESDWVDVNLFEYSDANDDGLIDIGEANDGFMEWGDDEEDDEIVTGEDY